MPDDLNVVNPSEVITEFEASGINLTAAEVRRRLLSKSPTANVIVNGIPTKCLLDTGAEASLLSAQFYREHIVGTKEQLQPVGTLIKLMGANDIEVPIQGYIETTLEVFGKKFKASLLVSKDSPSTSRREHCPVLLRCNILRFIASRLKRVESDQLHSDWDLALRWMRNCATVDRVSTVEQCPLKFDVYTCERNIIPACTVNRVRCVLDDAVQNVDGQECLIHMTSLCLSNHGIFREVKSGLSDDGSSAVCQVLEGIGHFDGAHVDVYIANASMEPLVIPALTQVAVLSAINIEEHVFSRTGCRWH